MKKGIIILAILLGFALLGYPLVIYYYNDQMLTQKDVFDEQIQETSDKIKEYENKLIESENNSININLQELTEEYLPKFSILLAEDKTFAEIDEQTAYNINLLDIAMGLPSDYLKAQTLPKVNEMPAKSADNIKKEIEELTGNKIEEIINTNGIYINYDEASKQYYYTTNYDKKAFIKQINKISKENGSYIIEYVCCFPTDFTNTQTAIQKFKNGNFEDTTMYKINIKLKENTNQEFIKYKIEQIKLLEKM